MKIEFAKYHALGNDFLVIEAANNRVTQKFLPQLAEEICDRKTGVGADGIVLLSSSRKADKKFDIYNSDGGWAEMSGNGIRIAGLHVAMQESKKKKLLFETATSNDQVWLEEKVEGGYMVKGELGKPEFETSRIPVKVKQKHLINSPITLGSVEIPVTCVAVGNPHTVLVVEDFDFDWQSLGADIEVAKMFPNRTNVEFVKVVNRKKIKVRSFERGAGPTGSSGTGAAASVSALVMLGIINRTCEVCFEDGSLFVNWDGDSGIIDLTGPVQYVMDGTYEFRKPASE